VADKKIPFPKYLNRPRLILIFEEDEVLIAILTAGIVGAFCVLIEVSSFYMVLWMIVSVIITNKLHKKVVKDTPNGFIYHFLYHIGLQKPGRGKSKFSKENESIVPYGFERHFID
jgi:hypothetical protein